MPINECKYSFSHLVHERMPCFLKALTECNKLPMKDFSNSRFGVASMLKKHNLGNDFSGCYVFYKDNKPIYVGISKNVIKRVWQHIKGSTHFDASLAYKMAGYQHKSNLENQLTRQEKMNCELFRNEIKKAKDELSEMSFSFVRIDNPLELYLFEVYCAIQFDTSDWNSFETH